MNSALNASLQMDTSSCLCMISVEDPYLFHEDQRQNIRLEKLVEKVSRKVSRKVSKDFGRKVSRESS